MIDYIDFERDERPETGRDTALALSRLILKLELDSNDNQANKEANECTD